MNDLPIIDSCDGCGACCMEQSSPPGYLTLMSGGEAWCEEDAVRFRALPGRAKVELKKYVDKLMSETKPPWREEPCIWFNMETRRCRYYEHRPQICRDFPMGGEACHGWREEYFDFEGAHAAVRNPN